MKKFTSQQKFYIGLAVILVTLVLIYPFISDIGQFISGSSKVTSIQPKTTLPVYNASDVYTKAEVDNLLSQLNSQLRYGEGSITWDMLVRLNKCTIVKSQQTNGTIACDTICGNTGNMTCVLGEYQGTIRPCSDNAGGINTDRFCKCCGL